MPSSAVYQYSVLESEQTPGTKIVLVYDENIPFFGEYLILTFNSVGKVGPRIRRINWNDGGPWDICDGFDCRSKDLIIDTEDNLGTLREVTMDYLRLGILLNCDKCVHTQSVESYGDPSRDIKAAIDSILKEEIRREIGGGERTDV